MPKNLYWDSNVFLDYVEQTPFKIDVLDAIVDDALIGKVHLFTSVFSIAEVAFARYEQTGRQLDPIIEVKLDKMWADRSAVTIVEMFDELARKARAYMREALVSGWSLKGKDAIHLATAHYVGVDEIHTYEPKWLKFSSAVGIHICAPYSTPQLKLPFQ